MKEISSKPIIMYKKLFIYIFTCFGVYDGFWPIPILACYSYTSYIIQIKICAEYLGWICQVHLGFGLSASAQVPDKPALAWVACPGILHRS